MSEYGNFEGFGGSITSPEDMFYSPNYPSGGTGSIDRPDLYPPGGTDPQQTPEDRRAELDEKLANDPFYNNLGSDGARELYRQYIYEGTTVGGEDGGTMFFKVMIPVEISEPPACQTPHL